MYVTQAQRAAEDLGKNIPSGGDVTSGIKNAVPALPKVRFSSTWNVPLFFNAGHHSILPDGAILSGVPYRAGALRHAGRMLLLWQADFYEAVTGWVDIDVV